MHFGHSLPGFRRPLPIRSAPIRWIIGFVFWGILAGCSAPSEEPAETFLLRVGDIIVTPEAFQKRLALSQLPATDVDSPSLEPDFNLDIKLQELVEELLIRQYAAEHGIEVSAHELEQSLAEIRGEMPADEFEQLIIESAHTPDGFRERVRIRLLSEKAVQHGVLRHIVISAEDVKRYLENRGAEEDAGAMTGTPSTPLPDDLLGEIRLGKRGEAYQQWLQTLRQRYPVEVDPYSWQGLADPARVAPPNPARGEPDRSPGRPAT